MASEIGDRVRARINEAFGSQARQGDVAEAVGMSADAFSRALSGQRNFATVELVRLANYLRTSLHWLATGTEDPNATRVAARHTFDPVTRSHDAVDWSEERSAIETVATAYAQVAERISRPSAEPVPSTPAEARRLLAGTGAGFVRTLAESIEQVFGIDVVRVPEAARSYSILAAGHRVIVVPPHINWFHQNWSLAHELGHFASGNLVPIAEASAATAAAEAQANAFAAELLLPEREIRAIDWNQLIGERLAGLLWDWGVSTDALRRRLAVLQIFPSDAIAELLRLPTQRVLRRNLPRSQNPLVDEVTERMERANTRRFPATLLSAHTEAVSAGDLGAQYLAWMLDANPTELEREIAPPIEGIDLDWLAEEMGQLRES